MSSGESKSSAEEVILRLKNYFGVQRDAGLCKRLGIPTTTMGSWKSRGHVPFDVCARIADDEGLSVDWILTGRGYPEYENERARLVRTPIKPSEIAGQSPDPGREGMAKPRRRKIVQVEVVGPDSDPTDDLELEFVQIPKLAIRPGEAVDATPGLHFYGEIALRRDWLKQLKLDVPTLAYAIVTDDSMMAALAPNDLALVVMGDEVKSGKTYAINVSGELQFKHLQRLPDGSYKAFSESANYPAFVIGKKDLGASVKVLGRVVASFHAWG